MKNLIYLVSGLILLYSCDREPFRNQLLEAKIDGQYYSFTGSTVKYTDFVNNQKTAYDYQVYNHGTHTFLLEAYDDTFTGTTFPLPVFSAQYIVQLEGGQSKTYQAVSGQFRILGQEQGNLRGEFYFKAKNVSNPQDSVMVTDGYFDIYLEQSDRTFP
jgi:hypothetical protein